MKYIAAAPICRAAGMESARSTPPPIDAGSIMNQIQNQHNNFPQPAPATVWPKDKHISSNQLQYLLADPNPEIRKAAVKSSRAYILNSSAPAR